MGKRLGEYTHDNTKCMLEVNGVKLIDRALACLHDVGVSRIVLVVGYKGQNVRNHVGSSYKGTPVVYVENPIYDRTNNIYSLYLAKDHLHAEDTVLLESDLIFDPVIVRKLTENPFPNIALVDKYESWMDGTVVTIDEDGQITGFIDKADFRYERSSQYYKTVNIYKFSKEFSARYYVPFLEAYCTAMGNNEYYEQVLRVILHLHNAPLTALPLSGEKWYEIDDVQDLDIASGMFAQSSEERFLSVTSRYGGYWRYPQMLDYCYLVNQFFPPQEMMDEMKASFEKLVCDYPSGMNVNSHLASKNFNVKQDYIVAGNGAAELIKLLMEGQSGTIGNVLPTFEEYPNRVDKEKIIPFVPQSEDFHYSAKDLMAFFADKPIDTLLLINPDNPSGNYIAREEMLGLVEWTKQKKVRLIVDESFVDFADEESSLLDDGILRDNPHLFVVKSIGKSFGVPGIRLGVVASGDVETISGLKKEVPIWNVNSFGEFFMQIFEKYRKDYLKACEQFRKERAFFRAELEKIPYLKVFPSQANYFLCKVSDKYSSRELAVKLFEENILIKDCSTKAAFKGRNYIRLAVKNHSDNLRVIQVLRKL